MSRLQAPTRLSGDEATRANFGTARASVLTAAALGILKLAAAITTGSLSVVASLVDSVMDVLASAVNLFAVRLAGQPADEDHAYGHGKAEGLAGIVQAVVVGFSGVFLLIEGARRLIQGEGIGHTDVGIVVMLISTVVSVWITWRLKRMARRTGSVALAADAVHYQSDIWTNLGVLAALVAIRITGWHWIDGLIAVLVSFVVIGTAVRVLRRAAGELMDRGLPDEEVGTLIASVREAVPELRGMHDVRTRKAGPQVFMDCHVQFDRELSFVEAHRLSEQVRLAIQAARPGALVNVHADPHPFLASDLDEHAADVEVDPATGEPLAP